MGGDKVQFRTNVAAEVALKYGDGKDVAGQYGDQVLYTLTDGRVMYVPPIVRKQIQDFGIARGELFTITKTEKKNGTRRTIEWIVSTNGRAADQPARARPTVNNRAARSGSDGVPGSTTGSRSSVAEEQRGAVASGGQQLLLQAFTAAVDVAAETERYAGAHGISLQFTSEDVRQIGLSIYARAAG